MLKKFFTLVTTTTFLFNIYACSEKTGKNSEGKTIITVVKLPLPSGILIMMMNQKPLKI